jgi:DNA primase
MELFLDTALPSFVVELPGGEDPDSFLRKQGGAAFADRLAKARPIFDWFFRNLLQKTNIGSVDGKLQVWNELKPRLQRITNPVERGLYVKEISRVLEYDESKLLKELGGASVNSRDLSPQREQRKSRTCTEDMLLALMGKYPEVANKVIEYGVSNLFPSEFLPVAEAILAQSREGHDMDWGLILDQVGSPEERSRLAALFIRDEHLEGFDPLKMFNELCNSKKKQSLHLISELRKELDREDPENPRYIELMEQIETLRKKKSQLL